MRMLTTVATGALLVLGVPALAQSPAKQSPEQAQTQSARPTIRSVQIVDVKDLSPDVRTQVDDACVAHERGGPAIAAGID